MPNRTTSASNPRISQRVLGILTEGRLAQPSELPSGLLFLPQKALRHFLHHPKHHTNQADLEKRRKRQPVRNANREGSAEKKRGHPISILKAMGLAKPGGMGLRWSGDAKSVK